MAAVTVDPLAEEALAGLKDPRALLRAFNRLQEEASVLNGGLTAANFKRVVLAEREVVTPSEWVPLTLQNGFTEFGPTDYATVAVRKQADGRVEIRENVRRSAGSPSISTVITTVGPAYAPSVGIRRVGDANGLHAVYDVLPTGQVRWLAGDPTAGFAFCGGSWPAYDRSVPPWPTPLRVALNVTGIVAVREVRVVARAARFDGYGPPVPCTVFGPTVERSETASGTPTLSIPRIDGLQPEQRYKITLWVFLD